jgi:hypothetical protein
MISRGFRCLAVPALVVSLVTLCSCSKGKEAQEEEARPVAQPAAEAVQDFGKKPMDKARAVQKLGDDRTRAVDEAVGSETKQ